ncbi:MAG: peptide deformylase [Gemmatimonadales bacterium]
MALRPLHLLGSPALRQRAAEVGQADEEVRQLVEDLLDTMRAERGIGLAANQVGVTRRVAVVQVGENDPIVLIDPVIIEREGTVRDEEGCLSIPEIFADVERAARIVVETTSLDNERRRIEATDLTSRAIQHEIDHLDGVLFLDHLSPLKRRMLLKKWKKMRKGTSGYVKEVSPAAGQPVRF